MEYLHFIEVNSTEVSYWYVFFILTKVNKMVGQVLRILFKEVIRGWIIVTE